MQMYFILLCHSVFFSVLYFSQVKLFYKHFGDFPPIYIICKSHPSHACKYAFLRKIGGKGGRILICECVSIPALTSFGLRSGDVDDEGLQLCSRLVQLLNP